MQKTKQKILGPLLAALVLAVLLSLLPALTVRAETADSGTSDASVTFTPGDLDLLMTPQLNFGSHTIDAGDTSFAAQELSRIRVSDARGTGDGWSLLVRLSPFQNDGAETLQGSKVVVTGASVAPFDGTVGEAPTVPVTEEEPALTVNTDNQDVKVLLAEKDTGRGVWDSIWPGEGTQLVTKPGTAKLGLNSATLAWSLQDAP